MREWLRFSEFQGLAALGRAGRDRDEKTTKQQRRTKTPLAQTPHLAAFLWVAYAVQLVETRAGLATFVEMGPAIPAGIKANI